MTPPWKSRKQAARLAALRQERADAYNATRDALERKDTRGYHAAIQRLVSATHAVMKAELQG